VNVVARLFFTLALCAALPAAASVPAVKSDAVSHFRQRAALAQRVERVKPFATAIDARLMSERVIAVKFRDDVHVRLEDGRVASVERFSAPGESAADDGTREALGRIEAYGSWRRRNPTLDEDALLRDWSEAESSSHSQLANPVSYFRFDVRGGNTAEICDRLNRLAIVEIAEPLGVYASGATPEKPGPALVPRADDVNDPAAKTATPGTTVPGALPFAAEKGILQVWNQGVTGRNANLGIVTFGTAPVNLKDIPVIAIFGDVSILPTGHGVTNFKYAGAPADDNFGQTGLTFNSNFFAASGIKYTYQATPGINPAYGVADPDMPAAVELLAMNVQPYGIVSVPGTVILALPSDNNGTKKGTPVGLPADYNSEVFETIRTYTLANRTFFLTCGDRGGDPNVANGLDLARIPYPFYTSLSSGAIYVTGGTNPNTGSAHPDTKQFGPVSNYGDWITNSTILASVATLIQSAARQVHTSTIGPATGGFSPAGFRALPLGNAWDALNKAFLALDPQDPALRVMTNLPEGRALTNHDTYNLEPAGTTDNASDYVVTVYNDGTQPLQLSKIKLIPDSYICSPVQGNTVCALGFSSATGTALVAPDITIPPMSGTELKLHLYASEAKTYLAHLTFDTNDPRLPLSTSGYHTYTLNLSVLVEGASAAKVSVQSLTDTEYQSPATFTFQGVTICGALPELYCAAEHNWDYRLIRVVNKSETAPLTITGYHVKNDVFDTIVPVGIRVSNGMTFKNDDKIVLAPKGGWVYLALRVDRRGSPGAHQATFSFLTNDPAMPVFQYTCSVTLVHRAGGAGVLIRRNDGTIEYGANVDVELGAWQVNDFDRLMLEKQLTITTDIGNIYGTLSKVTGTIADFTPLPLSEFLKFGFLNGVIEQAHAVAILPEKAQSLIDSFAGITNEIELVDISKADSQEKRTFFIHYHGRVFGAGPNGQGVNFSTTATGFPGNVEKSATDGSAVLNGRTIDIGKTQPGIPITGSFKITNTTSSMLHITKFYVDGPQAYDVRLPVRDLAPGATATLFATLQSSEAGIFKTGIAYNIDTTPPSQADPFFTFDVTGTVCTDASCAPPAPPSGCTDCPPPPVTDPTIIFQDVQPPSTVLRSEDVVDVNTHYDYRNTKLPYAMLLRVTKSGPKIRLVSWHMTTVQGSGISLAEGAPAGAVIGDGTSAVVGVNVTPIGASAARLELVYQYEGSSPGIFDGAQKTFTLTIKAGSDWVTEDTRLKYHFEDELGAAITGGAVHPDGTEQPQAAAFPLGTIDGTHISGRTLRLCNDGEIDLNVVKFWDTGEGDAHIWLLSPSNGWRHIPAHQCTGLTFIYSGFGIAHTAEATFKFFAAADPSPDRLASGIEGTLRTATVSTTQALPLPAVTWPEVVAGHPTTTTVYRGDTLVPLQSAAGKAAARIFTLVNNGSAALSYSNVKVTGTGFSLVPAAPKPGTLAPGGHLALRVRLLAPTTGTYNGTLELDSGGDPNGHFKVRLLGFVGNAASAAVAVRQGDAAIYNGGTYDTSRPLDFTMTNTSASMLSLGQLNVPAGYAIARALPPTLDAGATIAFALTRGASVTGGDPAAVWFETSDASDSVFQMNEVSVAGADDDYASTTGSASVLIPVLVNDVSPDGDTLTLPAGAILAPPAYGTAVVEGSGIRYAPRAGFTGTDQFAYRAVTTAGGEIHAHVYIAVSPAPVLLAVNDEVTTYDGNFIDIDVLANDRSPSGGTLHVTNPAIVAAGSGTLQLLANGKIRYQPIYNVPTDDTFRYEVSDGTLKAQATVTVHVVKTNWEPVATTDVVYVVKDTSIVIEPLTNDYDPDTGAVVLTYRGVVTAPQHGTLTRESFSSFRYTPASGFLGGDSFAYEITDTHGGFAVGTVNLAVELPNAPPVAVNDAVSTVMNRAITFDVIANDSDPDVQPVILTAITRPPASGTATVVSQSQIKYTPASNFVGTDVLTYQIQDGHRGAATADVTITVANQPPAATADSASTNGSTAIDINLTANDSDPDGDVIRLSVPTVLSAPPSGAAATRASDTSIHYTPVNGFVGTDTFTYQVEDLRGAKSSGTVSVTVTNRNPTAISDAATTAINTAITFDVVANDTDPDGHTLALTSVGAVSNGGTAVRVDSRRITYTPPKDSTVQASFPYTISDGHGGSANGSVTVTIANRPPVAGADSLTVNGSAATLLAVLANDSDPDRTAIYLTNITRLPAHGTAAIEPFAGIRYQTTGCYSGPDSLEYEIRDEQGATARATVTLSVLNDHLPVAAADAFTVAAGSVGYLAVITNDCDRDGEQPYLDSAYLVAAPASGTYKLSDPQTIRYAPNSGFHGTDRLTYRCRDAAGNVSQPVVVTITVP
jgi:hypothetical protein